LDQRKILCAAPDCIATGVVPFGRAKLLLSRTAVWLLNPTARRDPRPPKRGITEHQFGDPLQDNTRWLPPMARLWMPLQVVFLVVNTRLRTGHCILR